MILIGDCGGDDISWVSPTTSHQGCSVGGTQVILPNGYSELIDLLIEKYSLNDSIILNTPVTGIYQHQQSKSSSPIVNVQTSTSKVYTGKNAKSQTSRGHMDQNDWLALEVIIPRPSGPCRCQISPPGLRSKAEGQKVKGRNVEGRM